jgi:DNA-binding HxlR family transcriptional regulator
LLANRLKKFVPLRCAASRPLPAGPVRHEYILTPRGIDLYPVVLSIEKWDDTHMLGKLGR